MCVCVIVALFTAQITCHCLHVTSPAYALIQVATLPAGGAAVLCPDPRTWAACPDYTNLLQPAFQALACLTRGDILPLAAHRSAFRVVELRDSRDTPVESASIRNVDLNVTLVPPAQPPQ